MRLLHPLPRPLRVLCVAYLAVVVVVAVVTLVVVGIDALHGFPGGANLFGIYGMALTFPACLVTLPLSSVVAVLLGPVVGQVATPLALGLAILAGGVLDVAIIVALTAAVRAGRAGS